MEFLKEIFNIIPWWSWLPIVLLIIAIRDIFSKKHTILRNFPVIGHLRYFLEEIGPELRQYIVANNREELPFNRTERSWIYASSKKENNYQGFGTDRDIYEQQYVFLNNAMMPFKIDENHPNFKEPDFLPCAKVLGAYRNRRKPYRPASVINISAMSYGSLSAKAVEAMNRGAAMCNAYHNTGEGGVSPYHDTGSDIMFQFGTGYFGVRDASGNFSMEKMKALVKKHPNIRAIEIKLSQGAKPGKGGVLPASKITPEIAEIRGVPLNQDVISPPYHKAFGTVEEMVDFIEAIADATGLPVGIKSAIGKLDDWVTLIDIMKKTEKGPDFITIDGGEGGTGAAPPSFADHMSIPFMYAFTDVYRLFKNEGMADKMVFIASAKLGFPAKAAMAFGMGADLINVAREAMISIGCIQAQKCHNNTCPTGVATQNKWLTRGIVVPEKAERLNNYFTKFKKEFVEITHALGYEHPCQISMRDIDINLGDKHLMQTLESTFGYQKVPVAFESMQKLRDCVYLCGCYATVVEKQADKLEFVNEL